MTINEKQREARDVLTPGVSFLAKCCPNKSYEFDIMLDAKGGLIITRYNRDTGVSDHRWINHEEIDNGEYLAVFNSRVKGLFE